ncbi:MAG TPA: rhomboid family intramembrane serine protease [Pseudonocardiaceae bacterium]
MTPPPVPVCARHPRRETAVRCARCDRPACTDCLREASIGYQCVDCVAQGSRSGRRATTVAGAEPTGRSVVVPVLVAVNVAVYIVTAVYAGSLSHNEKAQLFQQWGLSPTEVAGGAWWRLVTSGFLHFGLLHLAFNMIALWVVGRDLEQVLGRTRFLIVYLVSLLGGSLAVFVFADVRSMTAGASGAVFGLFGGLAVVLLRMRRSPGPVLAIIAINVAISFAPGLSISIFAHLGGLVFGTVVTAGMVYAPRDRRVAAQTVTVLALLAVIAVGILARDAQF